MFNYYRLDVTISIPTYCIKLVVDKRKINVIAAKQLTLTKNVFKKQRFDLIDTGKELPNYKVRVLEKRVTLSILKEYKEFKHLFTEVVDSNALLKH